MEAPDNIQHPQRQTSDRERAARAIEGTLSPPPKRRSQQSSHPKESEDDAEKENIDPQQCAPAAGSTALDSSRQRAAAAALCCPATPLSYPPISSPAIIPRPPLCSSGIDAVTQLSLVPALQLAGAPSAKSNSGIVAAAAAAAAAAAVTPTSPAVTIAALPTELLARVLGMLHPIDLLRARRVCRLWRACVDEVSPLRRTIVIFNPLCALLQRSAQQQRDIDRRDTDILAKHTDLKAGMRQLLVDWMLEAARWFGQPTEAAALSVRIVEVFLMVTQTPVPRTRLQLLGAASLWIASKLSHVSIDDNVPTADDLCAATAHSVTVPQLVQCETEIAAALRFRMLLVTAHEIAVECLALVAPVATAAAAASRGPTAREEAVRTLAVMGRRCGEHFAAWAMALPVQTLKVSEVVEFLLDIALHDHRFTAFTPTLIAISALHIAFAVVLGILPGDELCRMLPEALASANPQRNMDAAQCMKLLVDTVVDFHSDPPPFLRSKHHILF